MEKCEERVGFLAFVSVWEKNFCKTFIMNFLTAVASSLISFKDSFLVDRGSEYQRV